MSGSTRLWNGAEAVQGEWCSADVNSGSFLHCSVLESKSMFCFCNESNQKMNQYGWRHFTDVRRYFCRFYMSVKITFQYRKEKNPFLIRKPFQNVCLWTPNSELEGSHTFQVYAFIFSFGSNVENHQRALTPYRYFKIEKLCRINMVIENLQDFHSATFTTV